MYQIIKQSYNGAIRSVSFSQSKFLTLVLLLGYNGMAAAASLQPSDTAGPTEVEMVALMEEHYNSAILSHDALIQGDLETLRSRLSELESQVLPPAAPQAWRPYDARLRKAARSAASISSLDTAGPAMSAVAEACGACHAAVGVGKIYFRPAPPHKDDKLKTTMRVHQWATERLWEGVTGPFEEAWNRGAAVLAKTRVFESNRDTVKSSLLEREAALRDLGQTAKRTMGLHERALIYGRLLTTCAECHQEAGVSIEHAKSKSPKQK